MAHKSSLAERDYDCLQDLPMHCLVENQTEGLLISIGLAIMLLELSGMYCTLTYVLNLTSKHLD